MTTANYETLYNEIKSSDRAMAPGSETAAWGQFLNRMKELGISDVREPDPAETVPQAEADWWLEAYSRMAQGQDWEAICAEMS